MWGAQSRGGGDPHPVPCLRSEETGSSGEHLKEGGIGFRKNGEPALPGGARGLCSNQEASSVWLQKTPLPPPYLPAPGANYRAVE